MKLEVFRAGKGDCLLLTAADGTHVLVDGGMREDYREHVAAALGELAAAGTALDLVYVSHIDRDHISGVLQLMDDTIDWRVFDFQRSRGNERHREPPRPRPPKVAQLWHNAFHEQVEENAGVLEDLLAADATVLEASGQPLLAGLAGMQRDLATSVSEGIELSRRASPEQLGIPVNEHFGGRLAFARDDQGAIQLGSMTIGVIGPFAEDLERLRAEWNEWLEESKAQHERLQRRMERDAGRLAAGEVGALREPLQLAASELGKRSRVTVPNLASLMLLVEEDGSTLLLTGDGHARDVLHGLERIGKLNAQQGIHVDVLKVPHHGSEHNLDEDFARRVTARVYVFCANGEHKNPDPRVVEAIIESRIGAEAARTLNPEAGGNFELVFNCSSAVAPGSDEQGHMRGIEQSVRDAAERSGGRLTFSFLDASSVEVDV